MARELSPGLVLRAVARVVYADLVTVVVTSVAFVVASLPIVTIGAAVLALVDTWTDVITHRDTGAPPSERGRLGLFATSYRRHLRTGLPYSLLFVAVVGLTAVYASFGLAQESGPFVVAAIVGVYLVVVVTVWSLRAATFQTREEPPITTRMAFERAGLTLLDRPAFAVILSTIVGVVLVGGAALRVTFPLLVPGILAVVEVVAFEEHVGDGAATVRATYRRES
jgi:hypothetical protein